MDYRVIKENDLFILSDKSGNIPSATSTEYGLYTKDTRFLSTYKLSIEGIELVLLSSEARQNYVGTFRLTNTEVKENDNIVLWRESIGIKRKRFIYNDAFYERIYFENYNTHSVTLKPRFEVAADYSDMFIVRGFLGGKTGVRTPNKVIKEGIVLGYEGSDGITRQTKIEISPRPDLIEEAGEIGLTLELGPESTTTVDVLITPVIGSVAEKVPFDKALHQLESSYKEWNAKSTKIESDSKLLNDIYSRSLDDLRALLTNLGEGSFPVAGIPWFAVPFGRDSLIAAIQMLVANVEIAKGTLKTLAKYQGKNLDSWRDEQPGKILHEIRFGELANNNEIPHTPYYGTVDATPLFLVLAVEYYRWTGDKETITQILPNIKHAIQWIEQYGDRDSDGFVEYYQESSKGIANQAWKDSGDSVVHRNGEFAKAPIAIAEVQGYVYDAKVKLAAIFREFGDIDLAEQLTNEAAELKKKFAKEFWLEEEQFVAIALDKHKKKVESVTTNPGHCLWSNLLNEEQAKKVVARLVSDDMFTGYGIRTMSSTSTRYNPMSYHDGSIWPHDNSLIFLGMKEQGYAEEAMKVIQGLLDAANHFEYNRLPELFCGYSKSEEPYPVDYPVACSPQAWAAGTSLVMIQAMLGIKPDVPNGLIKFLPSLPSSVNKLTVKDIAIGKGHVSVQLIKEGEYVLLEVLANTTGLTIINEEKQI
ncbi:amylo-alpha-1,6-glucosidase [Anaerobacillus sp. CMMVII]|uniref:amylo-alpha-1,6-glucosidase n=1 Tax=Anaerobacillus sp. CMMVII TaxID=2755588 RepID=UPI0021B83B54|nr:amylo-alpha-1,6-glucosidase [Anaerobacillus sp. CMMVII]MCT8137036.1 amylo-alpha-1,6-glucosidase [Anaerobacillus sp. CMMVII]